MIKVLLASGGRGVSIGGCWPLAVDIRAMVGVFKLILYSEKM
jgi:hypothetical protein